MRCGRGGGKGILDAGKICTHAWKYDKVWYVGGVDNPFGLEIIREMKKNARERMMGDEARKLSSKQVVKISHSKEFETNSLMVSEGGITGSLLEEYIF